MFHHGNLMVKSAEAIKPPTTSDNSYTPSLSYCDTKTGV